VTLFRSILVPLDGSRRAVRSLGCAAWLATQFGGRLHVLSATAGERPARDELRRLRIPEATWSRITLHQAPADAEDAILDAIARYDVSLVVISADGQGAEELEGPVDPERIVGHVTRAVIERSACPVLLMPPRYEEVLPWTRVLVPVSGEVAADEALALAVRLADALDLSVHVAHVAETGTNGEGLAARARYADALHHEYSAQLEELVDRALPHRPASERRRIEEIVLCRGDASAELATLIERKAISLLAVGWRGRFMTGRARVLKQLVQVIAQPILLVKPQARVSFRLHVGENME
jgi:nucleotide-binding universal stress UspA family protein